MVVRDREQYVAVIGDRLVHVGDEINGFTVTAVEPNGVHIERKATSLSEADCRTRCLEWRASRLGRAIRVVKDHGRMAVLLRLHSPAPRGGLFRAR